jgi:endonuclease G
MANWVAYCSDRSSISGSEEQSRDWEPDPAFPESVQLEPNDYEGIGKVGYDRGHQAPLASFRGMNWKTTNYTTNITPQAAALNRGAWVQLEKYERSLVTRYGSACVITGPYFEPDDPLPKLPNADEPYQVPSGYWKVIAYQEGIESYVYDQLTPTGVDFQLGRTCNDEVERFSRFLISDRTDDAKYCPQ